jgi:23S rRNA pseudouridine1911/1915/1917 synthase
MPHREPQTDTRSWKADRGDAGRRIDLVVRRQVTDIGTATRTRVQKWIASGYVTLNDAVVRRVATRAAFGDSVTLTIPAADAARPRRVMLAEAVPLDIVFEDDHLLIVNKPAGLVVHPSYGHPRGTLMNGLLWRARQWTANQRPSLVGRLDKQTSGLVVVAKTRPAHAALQAAFARPIGKRDVRKDYLALVYGRVPARGKIELRLRRDPHDRRKVIASPTVGAPSETLFERLARVKASRVGLALLRCRLGTGRTHQIRVHLAASGWPLVGDPKYGAPRWSEIADVELAAALRDFPRQALHAWRTAFRHPVTQALIDVEAPVPQDLSALLASTIPRW